MAHVNLYTPGIILIVFVIFVFSYYPLRNRYRFSGIKKSFGISDYKSEYFGDIRKYILGLTQKIDKWLTVEDYVFLSIDGKIIPIVRGTAFFATSSWHGASGGNRSVFYAIVKSVDEKRILDTHQNIFKLEASINEVSVFWIKDIKALVWYLKR